MPETVALQALRRLDTLFKRSAFLYALFLLPTLLLAFYGGGSDSAISRSITGTWQGEFWHFPGFSALGTRIALDVLEFLAISGLTFLFWRGFQTLSTLPSLPEEEGQALTRRLLRWIALLGLILLLVVPFHSSDLYGYLNRGFQQSLYHSNPYLTPVAELPGWTFNALFHPHWVYNPCPYGFFFAQLAHWLSIWSGASFIKAFVAFKTLNLLSLLACTALIAQVSRQLGQPRPWLAAYSFGANPLVLLHGMGNGHNDVLMAVLMMASLSALLSRAWRWLALPLLALSVLTKYATLLLAPFWLLYLLKHRHYRALTVGLALALGLTAMLGAPYVDFQHVWPWRALLDNAGKPQHSLVDLLARLVYYPAKWLKWPADLWMAQTLSVLKPLVTLGGIGAYGVTLTAFARQETPPSQLLRLAGAVMTVLIVAISAKFHPWYPVMFLPLLLLLPDASRWRHFGLLFSLFQLLGFTVLQNLPVFGVLAMTITPAVLAWQGRGPFKPASALSPPASGRLHSAPLLPESI